MYKRQALNDATTLPKPILKKLIDKAINEKLWSDDDINNFNEHKNNMNYVWNFLSDAAKAVSYTHLDVYKRQAYYRYGAFYFGWPHHAR